MNPEEPHTILSDNVRSGAVLFLALLRRDSVLRIGKLLSRRAVSYQLSYAGATDSSPPVAFGVLRVDTVSLVGSSPRHTTGTAGARAEEEMDVC